MNKKRAGNILASFMFIIGTAFLANSRINVTGAALGAENTSSILSIVIGGAFLILAAIIFSTVNAYPPSLEHKIILTSSIKEHPSLWKLTEDTVKDEAVEREMNHLIKEMSKGNFEAGLGAPGHIKGTKINYLRGRNGARLLFREKGEGRYDIVAKASKKNEQQVIDAVKRDYKK